MAKHNAYMQFWIGDYLADTPNLSTQRHGTYFLMIMYYWKHSELPDDLEELYEITKTRNEKGEQDTIFIRDKYFPTGNHKRLDQELNKALDSYNKRVDAQKKSLEKRKENSNASCNANTKQHAKHLQSYDSDSDSDSDNDFDFDFDYYSKSELEELFNSKFWDLWGKGSRKSDARKWFVTKGVKKEKPFFNMLEDKINELFKWRKESSDAGEFVPQLTAFTVWLNQSRWEDELSTVSTDIDDGPTWEAYSQAYNLRYGVMPTRNAAVNGQLSNFCKRVGKEDAPEVAAFFLRNNSQWYINKGHSVASMLVDAEKIHVEWKRGKAITTSEARQIDKTQTNYDSWNQVEVKE